MFVSCLAWERFKVKKTVDFLIWICEFSFMLNGLVAALMGVFAAFMFVAGIMFAIAAIVIMIIIKLAGAFRNHVK